MVMTGPHYGHSGYKSGKAPEPGAMRIIGFALVMGTVVFAGVVYSLTAFVFGGDGLIREADVDSTVRNLLVWLPVSASVPAAVAAFLMRGSLLGKARRIKGLDEAKAQYALASLIFLALLEGVAFLNLVAWMLTGDPVPGALLAAVLIGLMISGLPSKTAFEQMREAASFDAHD